jgi:hypothetical protein
MTQFINQYMEACNPCLQNKNIAHKPHGLLQPNKVPDKPWSTLSTDFIMGLLESQDHHNKACDTILVVTGHALKEAHFIPMDNMVDAQWTADLYIERIFSLHRTPNKIITERGPQFTLKVMKGINNRLGITTALSVAYHPQVEHLNQELEQYLHIYTSHRWDDWAKFLPIAEFAHNNQLHSSIGTSPF